jgi:hypothetical protein
VSAVSTRWSAEPSGSCFARRSRGDERLVESDRGEGFCLDAPIILLSIGLARRGLVAGAYPAWHVPARRPSI